MLQYKESSIKGENKQWVQCPNCKTLHFISEQLFRCYKCGKDLPLTETPRICRTCGRRFKELESYERHLQYGRGKVCY